MARWDSGVWDQSYWSAAVGYMAATETGVDSFSASGGVSDTGVMAATESGQDTFASTGTVTVYGVMAATETGSDSFAASGSVGLGGYMAATETGVDQFSATGAISIPGYMAATETEVDTFSATGGVVIPGYMAATETGADTFAATGEVSVPGYMAATETEVDQFYAVGGVGEFGYMAAVETGEDTFYSTGTVTPPNPLPQIVPDIGDERQRKKAQKKRDEAFERYAQEQRKLREMLEQAIDPVKAKAEPVVVSQGKKKIEVLSTDGSKVSINVPALFDPEDVALAVAHMLEAANIAAQHVKRKQDEAQALAIARATVARIIKRKRDDELLLLLD